MMSKSTYSQETNGKRVWMSKKLVDVDKVRNDGRPVTTGSRPGSKYQEWMDSIGMNKDQLLEEFEKANTGVDLLDSIKRRAMALEYYGAMNKITADFYNNNEKRALALSTQLQEIDGDIKQHRLAKLQEDPLYSPVNDKQLLKWIALRADLMDKIRKQQMELTKLTLDKKSDDVNAENIDWDSI